MSPIPVSECMELFLSGISSMTMALVRSSISTEGSSSHLFAVSVKMLLPDPPASLFRRAAGRKALPISVGEQLKLLQ
jgi:hypothetical protein